MPEPTIYLALTDDWELRGDGSGDMEKLQLAPMRELLSIYNDHDIRTTVMAEVMQQLAFRREQANHSDLAAMADKWDEHILDAHRQGHDVQLHIHPQWSDATYEGGRWRLDGSWELSRLARGQAGDMVAAGKEYLEKLLRPGDDRYRCRAFRAGASAVAPGPYLLSELGSNGIDLDISMIDGYRVHTRNLNIDFTACEEGRLPYYPRLDDARKVSDQPEAIVCMPQYQFVGSRIGAARQIVSKAAARFAKGPSVAGEYAAREWASVGESRVRQLFDKVVRPVVAGKRLVADVGQLGGLYLPEVLPNLRKAARESGLAKFPAVLSNHSKDITDFDSIRRFAAELASARDVRTVTLTELRELISTGEIPVKTRRSRQASRETSPNRARVDRS
jgi:hypothetical protein